LEAYTGLYKYTREGREAEAATLEAAAAVALAMAAGAGAVAEQQSEQIAPETAETAGTAEIVEEPASDLALEAVAAVMEAAEVGGFTS
jgi:hypothetical protein